MTPKSIKGTETEKNLMKAFAGESQARNRYTFFASRARKEGYEQIGELFETIAANEQRHAKAFFKLLEGGMVEFTASYPAGVIGTTLENLQAAAMGEHDEWENLYAEYAQVAEDEGFIHIAKLFHLVMSVEKTHEEHFLKMLANVKSKNVFRSETNEVWECRKCGYRHNGTAAPDECPLCGHKQPYFELSNGRY